MRQLRPRSRRVARRLAPRHVRRRPSRLEGRRSLRRLRGEDAGPERGSSRAASEGPVRVGRVVPHTARKKPAAPGVVRGRLYDGKVGLSLVAGPANAGKVALLLERYLARLDEEPVLIVPTRSDVDRVERDLLARCGCLLGGSIGTFDDLFERIAAGDAGARPVATDGQRAVVMRRALARASLNRLAGSARTAGFAEALTQT